MIIKNLITASLLTAFLFVKPSYANLAGDSNLQEVIHIESDSVPAMIEMNDIVYAIGYLEVKSAPNDDSELICVLEPRTPLQRTSTDSYWSSVIINGTEYFVFNQHISTEVPLIKIYIGNYKLTAYCSCKKCCGKWSGGKTSSGTTPTAGRTVACNSLPEGTVVSIYGHNYIVEDTGAMKNNVIDIYMNSHQEALNFGVHKNVPIYIVK